MRVAIIFNDVILRVLPFDSIEAAQEFYPILTVAECPLEYEAGDYFTEGIFKKAINVLGAAAMRKRAYETEKIINYDDELMTVDEAEALAVKYMCETGERAEGIVSDLRDLITNAKEAIRERYLEVEES